MYKVKINCTPSSYIPHFLMLWQGVLSLTSTEVTVLTALLEEYLFLAKDLKEPYLSKILFSSESRKKLYTILSFTPQRFNNYIAYLKEKGVIQGEDGTYTLNKKLIPRESVTFEFIVQ